MKFIVLLAAVAARRSWEQNDETLTHASRVKFENGNSFAVRDLLLADKISNT